MRESTTKLSAAAIALIGPLTIASSISMAAPAVAAPSLGSSMPMESVWRACDFTKLKWVDASGTARAVARVGTAGPGTVLTTVDVVTALPNTRYDVRVIQIPRPSQGCGPGAPGVLTGSLQTDGVGAGKTAIQGALANGATGAWVTLERPSDSRQTPEEFYTTEYVGSI